MSARHVLHFLSFLYLRGEQAYHAKQSKMEKKESKYIRSHYKWLINTYVNQHCMSVGLQRYE